MRELVEQLLQTHRGKLAGTAIGIAFGLAVMYLGFFWTVFIGFCGLAGYLVGRCFDREDEGLAEALEELLVRTLKR